MQVEVNGRAVEVDDPTVTLLDVLRGVRPRLVSVKDGCAPQGQCGCCTVLVDGEPRVACVTPARRVAGRAVTTLEGLPDDVQQTWVDAFTACGASQCGFCTPGIIVRLAARAEASTSLDNALAAHVCRCTGWQTIREAVVAVTTAASTTAASTSPSAPEHAPRDLDAAARRASIEGRTPQHVGDAVARGQGGFAIDTVPDDARYAVPDLHGGWSLGDTLADARRASGRVQGRRTTIAVTPPLDAPVGDWVVTLRTSWVEPGYLEPDAAWCAPGGTAASPLANGGAFGAKQDSIVGDAARELADREGLPVCVVLNREDTVRRGPKRPPVAIGVRADGTGTMRVARTPGIAAAVHAVAPAFSVEEVDLAGPPTSVALRGAGWVEAAVAIGAATAADTITSPDGARATAHHAPDPTGATPGRIDVRVRCGEPLDEIVLRSYCIGAAHMAYSWVTSEQLAVDADGAVHDLTMRSFGIVKAALTPHVEVTIEPDDTEPVNGSDAVFAAVALAVWKAHGFAPAWPCTTDTRR